tara:strand:+ start:8780 stop:9592 length:813 start_codon:yes stop_codon:yes gene_type:complete
MTVEQTFAPVDAPDVPRDRWGRPLITPPDGGKPEPYVRVSTLAKSLDNKEGLMFWKQRMTAIGIGKRPDLAERAAITDPTDKKSLKEIIDGAMQAAESDKAANIGTTIHALTEQMDRGTLQAKPPAHVADLDAYEKTMSQVEVIATEMFVVNDHLKSAGTLDRLVRLPSGTIVVADLKTGATEPNYPHGVMTQCAIYANSWRYNIEKQERVAYLPEHEVSTSMGLLIHLPVGKAKCDLYLLDLEVGWQLAKTAKAVRDIYKTKPIKRFTP